MDESEQILENSAVMLKEKTSEYENIRIQDKDILDDCKKRLQNVEEKLERQKDYDEIKQQLLVIKKIELDDVDGSDSLSIEYLLSQKNKKLQGQLMEVKHLNKQQEDLIGSLKESLSKSESRVKSLTTLVSNLEADVAKLNNVWDSKPQLSPKMVYFYLKTVE